MKILCVIDSLGSGGAQRQLVELAKGFVRKGDVVSFLVYHKIDFYWDELNRAGIPVHHILEPSYLLRLYKMRKYIRSGGFDVVLAFLQSSSFICEVATFPIKRWKLIVGERSANPNIFSSLQFRAFRWFHFLADYVVANSYANIEIVRTLNPFLSKFKTRVIYNMVSSDLFEIPMIDYGGGRGEVLEIIIGASQRSLKNSKGMIQAVCALSPQQRSRIKIKWYGDRITPPFADSSYPEAVEMIKEFELGDVIEFFPATTDFLDHVAVADIVGLFSFFEGLPNAICEAMAMGKPVMASSVSDIPLILEHNLNQSFDPNDVESIVRCFEYYLNLSPEAFEEIGRMNRQVAKRLFSQELILEEYYKLLQ